MSRSIDYGGLMHKAMRSLIQEVLNDVASDGLPGQHHFFITFDTTHPAVLMADWLKERYPEEMTVVMQYWFDELDVGDEGFAVTLNFGEAPERLAIPYDAIKTFVDPSVEFGLRFESHDEEDDEDAMGAEPAADGESPPQSAPDTTQSDTAPARPEADVVSLDSFRK